MHFPDFVWKTYIFSGTQAVSSTQALVHTAINPGWSVIQVNGLPSLSFNLSKTSKL